MPRNETPEQKARWAAYMRDYRAKNPGASERPTDLAPTPRQIEILRAYADPDHGGDQASVASALGISKSAVHNSMQRLMRRLNVHDPSQAVMKLWVLNEQSQDVGPIPEPGGRLHRRRPPT